MDRHVAKQGGATKYHAKVGELAVLSETLTTCRQLFKRVWVVIGKRVSLYCIGRSL